MLAAKEYLNGIRNGERGALARAITLIESSNESHQVIAEELIELCLPFSGNSKRIGVTGVPGVGKSTFIESLGNYLIKEKKEKVAVLAIDPSSNRSKGSILGDKTRMNILAQNKDAFIRPSPSSGSLGGIARKTRESIILCEAAGYNIILVETVGVGQSETEVRSMVDFFLLLMLAGAGDELQGIKRGIMELTDAVVINKADGNNIDNAKQAAANYKNALHLLPSKKNGWIPKVGICSSITNEGIDRVWSYIEDFFNFTTANGSFVENRKNQSRFWLDSTLNIWIKERFYNDENVKAAMDKIQQKVMNENTSPFKAAKDLLSIFENKTQ